MLTNFHRNPKPLDYATVTSELRSFRELRNRGCESFRLTHPKNGGWWFGEEDSERSPCGRTFEPRCAFCGDPGKTVRDHCHTTGLSRGALCPSCNSIEAGRGDDDARWNAWRLAAPDLAVGSRWEYRREQTLFTFNDLMTAPIAWLFSETHRHIANHRLNDPVKVYDLQ